MKKFKLVALVGAAVMATMMFAGCSKEVRCELCGQTKDGDTYEIDGQDVDLCDDCHELYEGLSSLSGLVK